MLKRRLLLLAIGVAFLAVGCESDDGPQETATPPAKTVDKHNSAVITYGQRVSDLGTVISDTTSFYDGSGELLKLIIHSDTVPSLGMTKDTLDTGRTYEDDDGDTQPIDTVISHRRSYQFFITVK